MKSPIRAFSMLFLATLWPGPVEAQLTVSEPIPAGFNDPDFSHAEAPNSVRQVSATKTNRDWTFVDEAATKLQINVKLHYLMVDEETRMQIYQNLDASLIHSTTSLQTERTPTEEFERDADSIRCVERVDSPSRMTTSLLSTEQLVVIDQLVSSSSTSEILKSPSVLLLEGKRGEMNDLIERPFLIDFSADMDASGKQKFEPVVKTYTEGTRLQLACYRSPSPIGQPTRLHLHAQFTSSKILAVEAETVFGFGDTPMTLQKPQYQTKTSNVTETMSSGQLLLLDAHLPTNKKFEIETAVPMLGKLPYVGANFTKSREIEVKQYLMLVLCPSLVSNP